MSSETDEKENLPVPKTISPMRKALGKFRITEETLAKQILDELEAEEVKAFGTKGGVVYSKPLVAWDIRQRARMDAQRLLDLYPEERHRVLGEMTVQRSPEEMRFLREIAREVAERERRRIGNE